MGETYRPETDTIKLLLKDSQKEQQLELNHQSSE
jgi:hypothetical protein